MFYPDHFESNYERLIKYYPRYYREIREMDAILRMHGELADGLESSIERIMDDSFIDLADEETIASLEAILNIPYSNITGKTLEERKGQVKAFFIGNGHLSASMLIEMIKVYTEAEVDIEFTDYAASAIVSGIDQALYISIIREGTQNISVEDINLLLRRVIPAHIMYFVRDTMNTVLDCRNIETITLAGMILAQSLLESEKYRCGVGQQYILPAIQEGEDFSFIINESAVTKICEAEIAALVRIELAMEINFWDNDESAKQTQKVEIQFGIENGPETISGEVETRHDLYYLDGSLLLDGSVKLDATYTKEEL